MICSIGFIVYLVDVGLMYNKIYIVFFELGLFFLGMIGIKYKKKNG